MCPEPKVFDNFNAAFYQKKNPFYSRINFPNSIKYQFTSVLFIISYEVVNTSYDSERMSSEINPITSDVFDYRRPILKFF